MNEVGRIAALLKSSAIEKRIAAAIVLGELKAKGPEVEAGLMTMVESPVPALQRHGLDGLARVGAKKVVKKLFPLLASTDGEVRRAATGAVVSVGDDVVPLIRARMLDCSPEERRALDAVLAEVGGKEAFTTLLAGMVAQDEDAAKNAAFAVRQRVKGADASQRRSYLAETERFLKQQAKAGTGASTVAAAVKILGFLEEPKAVPTLLDYAKNPKQPAEVRKEAIIALRFVLGGSGGDDKKKKAAPPAAVTSALLDAASADDRTLAQTALHTLGGLPLTAEQGKRLEKLVAHPDLERARFVLEHLGRQGGPDAARILVKALCSPDKVRGQIAAQALAGNEEATPLLAKALLEEDDADRAWRIRTVLRPFAKKVTSQARQKLMDVALTRLGKGTRGWEALFDIVKEGDPKVAAEGIRSLASKLRKSDEDKARAMFHVLCNLAGATDADRYALAVLELAKSARDTRPQARAGDEALRSLTSLQGRGFNVGAALRKDKGVGLDELYYVGFHFAEEGHPLGSELLTDVVKKGGRAKVARMAKNKLALEEAS